MQEGEWAELNSIDENQTAGASNESAEASDTLSKTPLWTSYQDLQEQAWSSGFTPGYIFRINPPMTANWESVCTILHYAYRAPCLAVLLTMASQQSDTSSPPYQPASLSLLQIFVTSEG